MSKHVFISYQHDDGEFADNLIHEVEKEGFITWIDSDGLVAGNPWREGIDQAIRDAFALIVIMSPTAKASEYVTYEWAFAWGCGIKVIPIMYRKTELHPRLESLQYMDFTIRSHRPWGRLIKVLKMANEASSASLPPSLPPVPQVSTAPKEVLIEQKAQEWIEEGETFFKHKDYDRALDTFNQAILLDPNNVRAYTGKSDALYYLYRYNEAITASEQAIRLDPHYTSAWNAKGNALEGLNSYEASLSAYEQAIRLDPEYPAAWRNKGNILKSLKRYKEALVAYEQAIHLDPVSAYAWNGKGNALYNLTRYEEALVAYEQALRLDSNVSVIWCNKSFTLTKLDRTQEASECYKKARELGYKEEDWETYYHA